MAVSPRRQTLALALLTLFAGAPRLVAQEPATADIRGQVLVNGEPAAGATVVVHRVGPDASGPLDSLRSGRDGGFRFRLPRVPDPGSGEVFFASVEHGGINYFGPLIQIAAQLDSIYVVRAFDSQPAPPGGAVLPVSARYILLEEVPDVGWSATDLVHVAYQGERTLVSAPGGATFVYPLPAGATNLEIGGNQMAPDAATLTEDGNLRITSAIPPGEREFVVRYHVPDPFLTLRFPGNTTEAELLVKEPAPPMEVEGLQAAPPVEMEPGVHYRRYAGGDLNDVTVVIRRGKGEPLLPTRWLAVGLALLLASAALYGVLRPHPQMANAAGAAAPGPPGLSSFERRQRLLLEVAHLDEAHAACRIASADEWAARRRALLELVHELA